MPKVIVSLDITNKKHEFASDQAILNWISACLNCNVNNVEVQVGMVTSATEQTEPRVLVAVNGGIAETYSDDGIDVVIFDWDCFDSQATELGGVPVRFEDLAIQAGVPVEAATSSAADQPQG